MKIQIDVRSPTIVIVKRIPSFIARLFGRQTSQRQARLLLHIGWLWFDNLQPVDGRTEREIQRAIDDDYPWPVFTSS